MNQNGPQTEEELDNFSKSVISSIVVLWWLFSIYKQFHLGLTYTEQIVNKLFPLF